MVTLADLRALRAVTRPTFQGPTADVRSAAATYLATFSRRPMAAEPAACDAFLRGIERLAIEGAAALPEIDAAGASANRRAAELVVENGVAVVPVAGMLLKRPPWWARWFGATGYEDIAAQVATAIDSPDVRAVLLWIDSPGGEVAGMFETADVIAAAARQKPVVALADEMATSAAYMLAAPAGSIMATSTAWLGSIGVIATHVEVSKADRLAGYTYTVAFAGARKADGHPHLPLSEAARDGMNATVDRLFGRFVDAVAAVRPKLSADAIRDLEAGTFQGADAIGVNLADGLGTLDDVLAAITTAGVTGERRISTMSTTTAPKPAATPATPPKPAAQTPPAAEAPVAETTDEKPGDPAPADPAPADPAPADPAPADEASATMPSNVVEFRAALDKHAAKAAETVRAEERERAKRIAALCRLADRPDLAAHFVGNGTALEAVERELTNVRAGNPSDEIRALVPPVTKPEQANGPKRRESTRAVYDRVNAALSGQAAPAAK